MTTCRRAWSNPTGSGRTIGRKETLGRTLVERENPLAGNNESADLAGTGYLRFEVDNAAASVRGSMLDVGSSDVVIEDINFVWQVPGGSVAGGNGGGNGGPAGDGGGGVDSGGPIEGILVGGGGTDVGGPGLSSGCTIAGGGGNGSDVGGNGSDVGGPGCSICAS